MDVAIDVYFLDLENSQYEKDIETIENCRKSGIELKQYIEKVH